MIHIENINDFHRFLQMLGSCTMQDRGDHWFFFFPSRVANIIVSKDGPLVQPSFSNEMLAQQVKDGWPVFAGQKV